MDIKKTITSSAFWSILQQFSTQGIGFVVIIIMTRLILPEDFGLMGMIYIFVGIGTVLLEGGLTESLIRTPNASDVDYSSVFYINVFVSFLVYGIIFFLAPYIAEFYDQDILISILRIFCLTFIISAFTAVQNAILVKNMEFKRQIIILLPSLIVSSCLGIALAYMGYGVWSLVWSALTKSFLYTIQLWITSKWKPSFIFDKKCVQHHFLFGYKVALMEILNSIFANIFQVFIGKNYSVAQVGFYTQANTLKQIPVSNIYGALNRIAYPLFSSIQNDKEKLSSIYKRMFLMMTFIITPLLLILIFLGEPIILFLFTEKWLPALPYLQILCFVGILHPFVVFNMNIFKVAGRSDLFLSLGFVNKIFIIIGIVITYNYGITALLWSQVISYFFSYLVNSYYLQKIINYSLKKQLLDLIPLLVNSLIMSIVLILLNKNFNLNNISSILIGSIISLVLYFFISYLFKFQELNDLKNMLSDRKKI